MNTPKKWCRVYFKNNSGFFNATEEAYEAVQAAIKSVNKLVTIKGVQGETYTVVVENVETVGLVTRDQMIAILEWQSEFDNIVKQISDKNENKPEWEE